MLFHARNESSADLTGIEKARYEIHKCGLFAYRVPTSHYNNSSLPTYVLVLGIEGSGHHLILYKNKVVRYPPNFHLVGNRAAFVVDKSVSEIKREFYVGRFCCADIFVERWNPRSRLTHHHDDL
jgi:hypothetical protein